jgi:hypothetical protein
VQESVKDQEESRYGTKYLSQNVEWVLTWD